MKTIRLIPVLAMLLVCTAIAAEGDYVVETGRFHPDVTLPSIDTGQPVSLAQFRGKKTLLIHFASW